MGGTKRKLHGLVPSADLRFIERLEREMVDSMSGVKQKE